MKTWETLGVPLKQQLLFQMATQVSILVAGSWISDDFSIQKGSPGS